MAVRLRLRDGFVPLLVVAVRLRLCRWFRAVVGRGMYVCAFAGGFAPLLAVACTFAPLQVVSCGFAGRCFALFSSCFRVADSPWPEPCRFTLRFVPFRASFCAFPCAVSCLSLCAACTLAVRTAFSYAVCRVFLRDMSCFFMLSVAFPYAICRSSFTPSVVFLYEICRSSLPRLSRFFTRYVVVIYAVCRVSLRDMS